MSSVALSESAVKQAGRKAAQNHWLIYLLVVCPVLFRASRYAISVATQGRAEPLSILEIALLLAVFYQVYVRWLFQRKSLVELCRSDAYVFLFVLAAGISVVALLYRPVDHSDSFKALVRLAEYVALYLIISTNIRSWQAIRKLMVFLVGCGVAVSLLAFLQYFMGPFASVTRFPWGPWWNAFYPRESFRAYSFFFNPIYVGAYLSVVWPINLGLLMGERDKKNRSFFLAALLLNCGGILITFERTSIVGLAVGLLIFAKERARVAIAGGLLALLIGSYLMPSELRVRLFLEDQESRESITERILRYEEGLELYARNPIFGIGFGNYQSYFTGGTSPDLGVEYLSPTTAEVNAYAIQGQEYQNTAESTFLQNASEMGTLGLIAFIALCIHFLILLWRLRKKSAASEGWVVGLFAGLLSFLACSMFATLTAVEMNSMFWVLLGISKAAQLKQPRSKTVLSMVGLKTDAVNNPLGDRTSLGRLRWGRFAREGL